MSTATTPSQTKTKRASTDAPEAQRPVAEVSPDGLHIRELWHQDWRGIVAAGTTASDLDRNAKAFALCAHLLTLGDELTLFTADGDRMFKLLCVKGNRGTSAICHVLYTVQLPAQNTEEFELPEGYIIREAGVGDGQEGWLVIRTSDNHQMGQPMLSRLEAQKYLQNHAAVRAGTRPVKATLT